MIFLIFFCVLILYVLLIAYLYIRHSYSYWTKRGIPQEKPKFPYGNFRGVLQNEHFNELIQPYYDKFKKTKYPFAGVYLFISPLAIVNDLELIKYILIKDFNYFTDRGAYYNEKDDPLSAHLVLIGGQKWKRLRNKLSSTFTSGKMKYMFSTVLNVGNHLVDTVYESISQESDIEMKDILARYGMDVIGNCAFGLECNCLKDPDCDFRRYGRRILTERRNSPAVDIFMETCPNLARKLHLKHTPDDIEEFFMRIVRETIDYREKNDLKRNDFMQLLIQMKKDDNIEGNNDSLSLNEISAQAFLFFAAGFETSSSTMNYVIYELALNTNIQDKLRKEIITTIAKYNGNYTYEAMIEMKYMDQVINETLRKYPSIGLQRMAIKDYPVPNSGIIIEKGTKLLIPIKAIHYDPEIYPNPDIFDPERFSQENVLNRNPMAFLAFGDGPRNCIGSRFAMMQIRIGLMALLRNFQFEQCSKTPKELKFDPKSIVLNSLTPIYLKISKL